MFSLSNFIVLIYFLICRGMLHSNPMDYAWGANGLDAIITQVCTMFFFHMTLEKKTAFCTGLWRSVSPFSRGVLDEVV